MTPLTPARKSAQRLFRVDEGCVDPRLRKLSALLRRPPSSIAPAGDAGATCIALLLELLGGSEAIRRALNPSQKYPRSCPATRYTYAESASRSPSNQSGRRKISWKSRNVRVRASSFVCGSCGVPSSAMHGDRRDECVAVSHGKHAGDVGGTDGSPDVHTKGVLSWTPLTPSCPPTGASSSPFLP